MGLFDFFFSEESQIQKHTRTITNRDAQPEDRDASYRWLSEKGTPHTLQALLQRFEVSLEHQMKDANEKDTVVSLLQRHGGKAVEPVRAHLRTSKQVAYPLRLLAEIGGPEVAISTVYEMLEIERKKDDFKPEKKKALLIWLADQKHGGAVAAASPFLGDFDEGVRYAAAEVCAVQNGDGGREPLLNAFNSPREESNRLRVRICEAFATRGWSAEGLDASKLSPPWKIANGRVTR